MLPQFLTCAFVLSLSSCSSISNYASNDNEKITMIKNTIYIDDFDKNKHKIFFNIRNSTNQQIINKKFILSKISNDGYLIADKIEDAYLIINLNAKSVSNIKYGQAKDMISYWQHYDGTNINDDNNNVKTKIMQEITNNNDEKEKKKMSLNDVMLKNDGITGLIIGAISGFLSSAGPIGVVGGSVFGGLTSVYIQEKSLPKSYIAVYDIQIKQKKPYNFSVIEKYKSKLDDNGNKWLDAKYNTNLSENTTKIISIISTRSNDKEAVLQQFNSEIGGFLGEYLGG
jgi:hypothetical protein